MDKLPTPKTPAKIASEVISQETRPPEAPAIETTTKVVSQQIMPGKKVLHSKCFDKNKPCAEISFKEFLGFLRTAHRINESLEGNSNEECIQKYLDWQDVAKNELVASLLSAGEGENKNITDEVQKTSSGTSSKDDESAQLNASQSVTKTQTKTKSLTNVEQGLVKPAEGSSSVDQVLKHKLNELIQEGLLDSVLPYVVPKSAPHPGHTAKSFVSASGGKRVIGIEKKVSSTVGCSVVTANEKPSTGTRRKSSNGEIEVEIHVCDEVKNLKRDFQCPQKLLVSKMRYFAEVTTGQKLEDMDISVHCDIAIFDWLMRWVKQGPDDGPVIDATNVIPILVSAAFLQMDPLLEDCLVFCHKHMSKIIQCSTTLACINDSLLTRLANLFSNSEVETLKDRRDKISSRLYCKLIQSLAEPLPESARGHYASLAHIYRCVQCKQLVGNKLSGKMLCSPSHMRVSPTGNLSSTHKRDPEWNLNDYIKSLWDELQCWRLVYWRLWGDCHFMYCNVCEVHFPMRQARWCCYHPDEPQYFTKEGHRMLTFPIGRYPCCGERCYRFQPVLHKTGCQFKEHVISLSSPRDRAIYTLYDLHRSLVTLEPPELQFPHRLTRLVSSREITKGEDKPWWEGLELVPSRPNIGILAKWKSQYTQWLSEKASTSTFLDDFPSSVSTDRPSPGTTYPLGLQQSEFMLSEGLNSSSEDDSEDSEDSASEVSDESGAESCHMRRDPWSTSDSERTMSGHGWELKQTTRCNQDNQRDVEECQGHHMASVLVRRQGTDLGAYGRRNYCSWNQNRVHPGGLFVKVEEEWLSSLPQEPLYEKQPMISCSYEKQTSVSSKQKRVR